RQHPVRDHHALAAIVAGRAIASPGRSDRSVGGGGQAVGPEATEPAQRVVGTLVDVRGRPAPGTALLPADAQRRCRGAEDRTPPPSVAAGCNEGGISSIGETGVWEALAAPSAVARDRPDPAAAPPPGVGSGIPSGCAGDRPRPHPV